MASHNFDLTTLVGHFHKLQKSAEDILFPTHNYQPHACKKPHVSAARQEEPFGEFLRLVLNPPTSSSSSSSSTTTRKPCIVHSSSSRRSKQVRWADRVELKASDINGPRLYNRTSNQRINCAIKRAEKAVELKASVTRVELKASADNNGRLLYRTSNQGINSAIKRADKAAESASSNDIEREDRATLLQLFLFRTREEGSWIQ
jgi:hypothetical protein